jgi:hypothetical protein
MAHNSLLAGMLTAAYFSDTTAWSWNDWPRSTAAGRSSESRISAAYRRAGL